MDRLPTKISTNSEDFKSRRETNLELIGTLKQRLDVVNLGGVKNMLLPRSRDKMLARRLRISSIQVRLLELALWLLLTSTTKEPTQQEL